MQPDKPINYAFLLVVEQLRQYDTIKLTPELIAWATVGVIALLGLVACALFLVEQRLHARN